MRRNTDGGNILLESTLCYFEISVDADKEDSNISRGSRPFHVARQPYITVQVISVRASDRAICMHAVCASINAKPGTTNIAGHRLSVCNQVSPSREKISHLINLVNARRQELANCFVRASKSQ